MTLTEFLLARIAEDEAVARRCETGPPIVQALQVGMDHSEGIQSGWVEVDAGRVLAECEVKRRIVERHVSSEATRGAGQHRNGVWTPYCEYDSESWPCPDIADLALPFADHPDYQEAWRP